MRTVIARKIKSSSYKIAARFYPPEANLYNVPLQCLGQPGRDFGASGTLKPACLASPPMADKLCERAGREFLYNKLPDNLKGVVAELDYQNKELESLVRHCIGQSEQSYCQNFT